MNYMTRTMCFGLAIMCLGAVVCVAADEEGAEDAVSPKTNVHLDPEKKVVREAAARARREAEVERLNLPEDTSSRFAVKELRISGNTLISTSELLENMPLVYNASDKPAHLAEPGDLYDLRVLHDIIIRPGEARQVSRRTMQGLTEYILSAYQNRDYAGIYVYISAQAVEGGVQLQDGVLPIEIVETRISEITVTTYDPNREKVEKGILRSSVVKAWSPVKIGEIANQRKLDDFVNLLNHNPDRYVSAIISKGAEPNSLALEYGIYEANPWHFYTRIDSSGTRERQWAPRLGIVNTNLTGMDDRLSVLYQAPWESGMEDNYLFFGSYEFPVFTPWLRLNLYGGCTEFDTTGGLGIDFLGRGSFYGSVLRLNAFQADGWFFDIVGSLSHERSKVTPSLGIVSDVDMDLWGIGVDLHRSDAMSNTSLTFNRIESMDGSSRDDFVRARLKTDPRFTIYATSVAHSQYLDPNSISRLSGSLRLITSDERLVPSKMTTFGGLYSVRGYEEDEIVADGGLLLSAQYEFDAVKYGESMKNRGTSSGETGDDKPWLRKLAPLGFFDYGRAKTKDDLAGEKGVQELCSLGMGVIVELGDNFRGAMYYGWPIRPTDETKEDEGRFSFSFVLRF